MSVADAFRNASSIVKKMVVFAGVGLSATFSGNAHAGTLYDQCLVFVVDSSTSAQPKGWQGQMHGIAAGLTDREVVSKVRDMNTGILAGLVVFSSQVREMNQAVLRDEESLTRYASYIHNMPAPFGGSNNLLGALAMAEGIFQRIKAQGNDCLFKTVDFSGDGADSSASHDKIRLKVRLMADQGITIHGLSFYDLVFGKYRTRNSTAWISADQNRFSDIHQYYRDVIVTPAGLGVMPGQHFTIDNQGDANTVGSIVEQLTELMRRKVRYEVASRDDIRRARFAHALRPSTVNVAFALR